MGITGGVEKSNAVEISKPPEISENGEKENWRSEDLLSNQVFLKPFGESRVLGLFSGATNCRLLFWAKPPATPESANRRNVTKERNIPATVGTVFQGKGGNQQTGRGLENKLLLYNFHQLEIPKTNNPIA